jgi:hypothetical protein
MAAVLVPTLILAAAGLAFIVMALNDPAGRSTDEPRRLPTRQEQPLYHLHMRIRSSTRPPSASRASDAGVARFPRRR